MKDNKKQVQRILDLIPLMGKEDPLFVEVSEEISSLATKLERWALEQF